MMGRTFNSVAVHLNAFYRVSLSFTRLPVLSAPLIYNGKSGSFIGIPRECSLTVLLKRDNKISDNKSVFVPCSNVVEVSLVNGRSFPFIFWAVGIQRDREKHSCVFTFHDAITTAWSFFTPTQIAVCRASLPEQHRNTL